MSGKNRSENNIILLHMKYENSCFWTQLDSLLSENNKILLHMKNENSCFWTQFITARNSSCGKVMFSQAYVIPSVHGGGLPGGVCIQGYWADPPPQIGYYGVRSTSGRYASYWNAFLVEN